MINGMNIFYGSKTGSRLKVVQLIKERVLNQYKINLKKEDLVTKNAIKSNLKGVD